MCLQLAMADIQEGQRPVLGSLSMQLSLPTSKHHAGPVETQEADVLAVLAYHDALAQHLGSLLRSSSSQGPAAGATPADKAADADAAAVIPSSSETIASDRITSVADASAALPLQAEATPAMMQAIAYIPEKPHADAPQAMTVAPPPPRAYTNLELLAQRDAEHRRAWFLIGHSKYVGGVQDGFQLKMAPLVSSAPASRAQVPLDAPDSLIARRRKRKMLEGGGSARPTTPTEAVPRKRPRTMESVGTAPAPGRTLQQRRRVSHGDKDMRLSFSTPIATVILEPPKLSGVPLLERARKHSNRPKHISMPPAWTKAVVVPTASVAVTAVNAVASAQIALPTAAAPAAQASRPAPLYQRPSFTLQQPPSSHRRTHSDTRTVDKPSTPAATPGLDDTPARVAAQLGRHGSMASEGDMSGSSMASLAGASMTCRSVPGQDSAEISAKARFAGQDGPACKVPTPGRSLGLSPAMTPDKSGLLGILGIGIPSVHGDDVQESAAETDVKRPDRSASTNPRDSTEHTIMLDRRVEDEWWASYVDFET